MAQGIMVLLADKRVATLNLYLLCYTFQATLHSICQVVRNKACSQWDLISSIYCSPLKPAKEELKKTNVILRRKCLKWKSN